MNKEAKQMDKNEWSIEYLGVGFIKSRKSEIVISEMQDKMKTIAYSKCVELANIIVDDTSGISVDREVIDTLVSWMEKDCITVLVVRNIYDITKNVADLVNFIKIANRLGVIIYSIDHNVTVTLDEEDC